MSKTIRPRVGHCNHKPKIAWARCSDGFHCVVCNEGVCPDCGKLWAPTGKSTEDGCEEFGPACDCNTDTRE